MTTKSFQQKVVLGNENAQAQNAPAKGKILFRKVAPLVAAGFLAAGCGGAQKPAVCPTDASGAYVMGSNCTIPQDPQWKAEAPKEEPKPKETQCTTNTPLDCNARALQILNEFGKTMKGKGLDSLKALIPSSQEKYVFLENGKIEIRKAGNFTFAYKADYERGVVLFQLAGPAPSSPEYKVETKINTKPGEVEDDGMTPLERATTPYTEANQEITFGSGPAQPETLFSCGVSASGKAEAHILEFNPEGNPMMGKVIAVYDKENFFITLLTPYRQEWDARWYKMSKIWGPERGFSVASWSDGKNAGLFLIPNNFGPSDKVMAFPLIKNENGAYIGLENLAYFKFDGPLFDSVESQ